MELLAPKKFFLPILEKIKGKGKAVHLGTRLKIIGFMLRYGERVRGSRRLIIPNYVICVMGGSQSFPNVAMHPFSELQRKHIFLAKKKQLHGRSISHE